MEHFFGVYLAQGNFLNRNMKTFGMVMGANVEALLFLFAAHELSGWLDGKYPLDGGWSKYTYLCAVFLIGFSWFRMFQSLVRGESKKSDGGE